MGQQYGHTAPNAGSLPRGRTKVLRRTTAISPKEPSRPLGACAPCHHRWARSLSVSGPSAPRGCAPSRRARCGCVRRSSLDRSRHQGTAAHRCAAGPAHRRAGASAVGPASAGHVDPSRAHARTPCRDRPAAAASREPSLPRDRPAGFVGARPRPHPSLRGRRPKPWRPTGPAYRRRPQVRTAGRPYRHTRRPPEQVRERERRPQRVPVAPPPPPPLKDESRVPSWASGSA